MSKEADWIPEEFCKDMYEVSKKFMELNGFDPMLSDLCEVVEKHEHKIQVAFKLMERRMAELGNDPHYKELEELDPNNPQHIRMSYERTRIIGK